MTKEYNLVSEAEKLCDELGLIDEDKSNVLYYMKRAYNRGEIDGLQKAIENLEYRSSVEI